MKYMYIALAAAFCCSCSGIQQSGKAFTTHAESFNIVGLQIPGGEYQKAFAKVPSGSTITTISSNPSDWSSFLGVLNRIIGISYTEVSGTEAK